MTHTWSFLTVFLVRSTGFSARWLEPFRFPRARAAWEALASAQEACLALQAHLRAQLLARAPGTGYLDRRVCKSLQQWPPLPFARTAADSEPSQEIRDWITACVRFQEAQLALEQAVDSDLSRARCALKAAVETPQFAEAVFLSSHQADEARERYIRKFTVDRRSSGMRALERRLASYLQRFTAKNETNSFFGPVHFGRITPSAPGSDPLMVAGEALVDSRRGFLAWWAAAEITAAMAQDPALFPYLKPELHGQVEIAADHTLFVGGQSRGKLPDALANLLGACDGSRTCGAIAGTTPDPEQALAAFWQLLQRKLLTSGIHLPTALEDCLAVPEKWLEALPATEAGRASWQAKLSHVRRLAEACTAAEWPDKRDRLSALDKAFTELTGQSAHRAAGEMYADRDIYYEEARGGLSVTVSSELAQRWLEGLAPILDCAAAHAALMQAAWTREAIRQMDGHTEMPLLAFHRQVPLASGAPFAPETDPELLRFQAGLTALLREHEGPGGIQIPAESLRAFLTGWAVPPVAVTSPDLFVVPGDSNRFDLVVGEIHHGLVPWSQFLAVAPPDILAELETAVHQTAAALCPADSELVEICYPRYDKNYNRELPGWAIERGGRSTRPRHQVLPFPDLTVHAEGERLTLRSRRLGRPVRLHPTNPNDPLVRLFGLPLVETVPLRLGSYTPEIRIGDVVWQRARWEETDTSAFTAAGTDAQLYDRVQRLRQARGWPDEVYIRLKGERKPFYVDFRNLFFLEIMRTRLRDADGFTVSLALPSSDQWWLRGPDGTHSCELRLAALRQPQPT